MATVELRPMTAEEFAEFRETEPEGYGAEMVRAGTWSAAEAPAKAREEFARLLPQGLETPQHFLRTIRRAPDGVRVGLLWWGFQPTGRGTECFIWDIAILPAFRRQGFAEAAIRALEGEARRAGAREVALHVFGTNRAAIALYEKLGFGATNVRMSKDLG